MTLPNPLRSSQPNRPGSRPAYWCSRDSLLWESSLDLRVKLAWRRLHPFLCLLTSCRHGFAPTGVWVGFARCQKGEGAIFTVLGGVMTQDEITALGRKLTPASGAAGRLAGMWVVWRAGRSRGPGRTMAAVLCAGRVAHKRRDVLITDRNDRVRIHEAWVLPRSAPLGEVWPRWDELGTFRALEMEEAQRVLGEIFKQEAIGHASRRRRIGRRIYAPGAGAGASGEPCQ